MLDLNSLTGADGSPVGFLGCVHFSFMTAATAGGVLRVVRFNGRERLNEPFSYDVMLATSMEYDDVRTAVLGKAARLCVQTASPPSRRIEGLVASVTALGTFQRQRGDVHQYRVQLVPRLWLLSMRRTLRVFENKSLLDVALSVLADADIKPDVRLDPTQYAPVPFLYQRGESDLEFVNRLFALAGITYYFEHGLGDASDFPGVDSSFRMSAPAALGPADALGRNSNEKMVLVDSARRMTSLDGTSSEDGASDPPSLAYDAHGGYGLAQEEVSQFELRSSIGPSTAYVQTWSVFDHSPSETNTPLDTSMDATMSAESALIVSEYQRDPALLSQYEIDRQQKLAARALAQHRAATSVAAGKSDAPRLAPGVLFSLSGHPMDAINAPYYVTSTKCEGVNPQELPDGNEAHVYSTSFECSPVTLAPRPMSPPPQAQLGAEPATVIGGREGCPAVDERGRILVRFHWGHNDPRGDRRLSGTSGECAVQWLERWAGAGYGTSTLPRVGSEVWVEFSRHEGDSPIATGQLYSAANPAPFGAMATADITKVGVRTQTVPLFDGGASGYCEISIDDAPENELVHVRSQRDMRTEVVHDLVETIHNDRTERVEGDHSSTVTGDRTTRTTGNVHSFAQANETRVVTGMLSDTVTGPQLRTLVGPSLETYADDALERHAGHKSVVVGDSAHKRSHALYVNGTTSTTATGTIDLTTDVGLTIRCGETTLAVTTNSVAITSPTITLNGKTFEFTATDAATITAKTATVTTTDALSLSGKDATLNGSSSATIGSPKTTVAGQSANVVLDSKYTVQASAVSLGTGGSGPASQTQKQTQTSAPTVTTITLADTKGNPIPNARVSLRTGGKGGVERVVVLDDKGSATIQGTDALEARFLGLPLAAPQGQSAPPPASGDLVPYFVRQGDYLASLAQQFGFDADAVWNHSKNADLKKLRGDPNVLAPGDMLFIPKTEAKWMPLSLGGSNEFAVDLPLVAVSLQFTDVDGPMKGAAYTIMGADLPPGNLSVDGMFHANVASNLSEFVIALPKRRYRIRLGGLDPINTLSGVAQRLEHLGLLTDIGQRIHDHSSDEALALALSRFRDSKNITSTLSPSVVDQRFKDVQAGDRTGLLTTETLEALLSAHGS